LLVVFDRLFPLNEQASCKMDDDGNFEIKTDKDMIDLDLESLVAEMNITENSPTAMEDADIDDNDLDQLLSTLEEATCISLFVCFESHEQFFSYLATVTIAGDRTANLDLCLALTAFSSEGSFTCHTYCETGPPFLRSYPKDP
jgi:hypothetical protein